MSGEQNEGLGLFLLKTDVLCCAVLYCDYKLWLHLLLKLGMLIEQNKIVVEARCILRKIFNLWNSSKIY